MPRIRHPVPMRRRRFLAGVASALSTIGIPARGRTQAAPRLTLGGIPFNISTPIYAEATDAWKAEGLDVDVQIFQAGPMVLEGILANSLPAGDAGYIPALHRIVRGAPLIFCAADGYATKDHPWDRLLVRADSPYHSLKDLAGKSIGVVARGTVQDILLGVAAKVNGMKKSDFQIVVVPTAAMPVALKEKQIDAVYTNSPSDVVMELQGIARHLLDTTDFLPYMTYGGLIVSERWAEQNPQQAIKLIKGWISAGRWINANGAEARAVATRALKLQPDVGAKQRIVRWPMNGRPMMPNLWMTYNMMIEIDAIKPVVDPKGMMQRHFIEPTLKYTNAALRELGELPDPETERLAKSSLPYLDGSIEQYLGPWERT